MLEVENKKKRYLESVKLKKKTDSIKTKNRCIFTTGFMYSSHLKISCTTTLNNITCYKTVFCFL